MKLQKREITLNEADSMQDMLYLETFLEGEYARVETLAFRKETVNELSGLEKQTLEDRETLQKLWKKAKDRQL